MKRSDNRMEFRRRKVEQLILSGVHGVREITRKLMAEDVKTSPATTTRDIIAIRKRWAEEITPEKVEQYRIEHINKLNQMEQVIANPSLGIAPGVDSDDEEFIPDPELAMKAQKTRLSLLDSKAKVLGLYAPTKIDMVNLGDLAQKMKDADDDEDMAALADAIEE